MEATACPAPHATAKKDAAAQTFWVDKGGLSLSSVAQNGMRVATTYPTTMPRIGEAATSSLPAPSESALISETVGGTEKIARSESGTALTQRDPDRRRRRRRPFYSAVRPGPATRPSLAPLAAASLRQLTNGRGGNFKAVIIRGLLWE